MKDFERREGRVQTIDLVFESLDLGRLHAQRVRFARIVARPAQVGPEIEQIVLNPRQHRIRVRIGVQPRQPDHGIGLVDRAESRNPQVVLGHPRAVAK